MADMASVTTAMASSSFPEEDKKALMLVVASCSVVSPTAAAETKFQNFETLGEYLPASVVDRAGTSDFTTCSSF